MNSTATKKVLIICYSLSGQTSNLLARLSGGLESEGVTVAIERLRPIKPIRFPFGTARTTLAMMLLTFFRTRVPISPLSDKCQGEYDLIILAGPTWSYHPSGPVLSMLDRDGKQLFSGRKVITLISCRGYWRAHWLGLRLLLSRKGAEVVNRIIFTHPGNEPWRTIGVFLKLAGRAPEKSALLGERYKRYGHAKHQLEVAHGMGVAIGRSLVSGQDPAHLDFTNPAALSPAYDD